MPSEQAERLARALAAQMELVAVKFNGMVPPGVALGSYAAALVQAQEAAELTVLHFKRTQHSGTFQGDDEHEAWTELTKAIAAIDALLPEEGK
jgi:hypothetical protein